VLKRLQCEAGYSIYRRSADYDLVVEEGFE
jgi:hypothetical protein